MDTTRTTRTRRGDGYASQGAVRQSGGSLPVYICNRCNAEVVWATSSRTGRKYLADVRRGNLDQRYYIGAEVHTDERCQSRQDSAAAILAEIEQAAVNRSIAEQIRDARRRHLAGEISEDEYVEILDSFDEAVAR